MNAERVFHLKRALNERWSFLKMSDWENAGSHPVRLLPLCLNTFQPYKLFFISFNVTEKFLTRTKQVEVLKPLLIVYKSEYIIFLTTS